MSKQTVLVRAAISPDEWRGIRAAAATRDEETSELAATLIRTGMKQLKIKPRRKEEP